MLTWIHIDKYIFTIGCFLLAIAKEIFGFKEKLMINFTSEEHLRQSSLLLASRHGMKAILGRGGKIGCCVCVNLRSSFV